MEKHERLREILKSMDVPPARLELSDSNIRWLGRNMGIRNPGHKDFDEAVQLLVELGLGVDSIFGAKTGERANRDETKS